ncbi:MAG: hypothetical protein AAB353_14245 [Candidatus Hydrogenedentota bacterium]
MGDNQIVVVRVPGFSCDLHDVGVCVRGLQAESIFNARGLRARFEDLAGVEGVSRFSAIRSRKRLHFGLENELIRDIAERIEGFGPTAIRVLLAESPGAVAFAAKLVDRFEIPAEHVSRILWIPSFVAGPELFISQGAGSVHVVRSGDAERASSEIAARMGRSGGQNASMSSSEPVYSVLPTALACAPFYDLAEDSYTDSTQCVQAILSCQRMLSGGIPHIELDAALRSNGQRLAQALLVARAAANYSRTVDPNSLTPNCARLLKLSGCTAVSLRIHSGSQYMLDRYYRRGVTVSEAEQAVRACKAAGLFTVAQFTYPSELDDYHTCAETLRFIVRTRPHSALFAPDETAIESRRRRNARRDLETQAEALGVCVGVTAREGALAAAAGMEGREFEFALDIRAALGRGDAEYLRAIFEDLQERLSNRRPVSALVPPSHFSRAVVN